jgi:DTW domain-containing protein YfiP
MSGPRNRTDNRCLRCQIYAPLCLCSEIPRFELQTRVLVLMHWRERVLTTNTAHLACLALPNSDIHLRGLKHDPLKLEKFLPENDSVALLYPSDDAVELNAESALTLPKPLTLVVPDGSWRQANKVAYREKALKNVRRIKLPQGKPSSYRLRHSPHEENLSTFEAIARAIGILEGVDYQKKLERLFLMMVERRLWSRGKLLAKDVTTGLPEAAFEASRIAGAAGSKKRPDFNS